jgi:hypothetical protein
MNDSYSAEDLRRLLGRVGLSMVTFVLFVALAILGLLGAAVAKTYKRAAAIHAGMSSRCEACGGRNGAVEHVVHGDSYIARCPQCHAALFTTWWPYWGDEATPDVAVDAFLDRAPSAGPVVQGEMRDVLTEITRLASEGATVILRFR